MTGGLSNSSSASGNPSMHPILLSSLQSPRLRLPQGTDLVQIRPYLSLPCPTLVKATNKSTALRPRGTKSLNREPLRNRCSRASMTKCRWPHSRALGPTPTCRGPWTPKPLWAQDPGPEVLDFLRKHIYFSIHKSTYAASALSKALYVARESVELV